MMANELALRNGDHRVDDGSRKDVFAQAVAQALDTLGTQASKRSYRSVYSSWLYWTRDHELSPIDLSYQNVAEYLSHDDVSRATKQRRLSSLKKLAQILAIVFHTDSHFRAMSEALALIRIAKSGHGGTTRERQALTQERVYEALRQWKGDRNLDKRNTALLTLLFFYGLRRSEAVALRWHDLDLERGLLTISNGKGGKSRTIPLDVRLDAFVAGQERCIGRIFVFPSINKGDRINPQDKAMSSQAVYNLTSGLGFAPHDARRTMITDLLEHDTPLPVARDMAGHAHGSTTMRYAIQRDADRMRGMLKRGIR